MAIPGAKVEDLNMAFLVEYAHIKDPVDMLLMGGLNNVDQGESWQQVLVKMIKFKWDVYFEP